MSSYQHKRNTLYEIIEGQADIGQCIKTIATTQKGTVPYMPEFGCDLMNTVGEKPESAINYLIGVYSKEIPLQEPRCEVCYVTGQDTKDGQVKMYIYYKEKNNDNIEFQEVFINVR